MLPSLLFLVCGCTPGRTENWCLLPEMPASHVWLEAKLSEILEGGAEYTAPLSGNHLQPVELRDLDGDGVLEAIALFRLPGDEKPLKVYILKEGFGGYEVFAVIESEGSAIHSVGYEELLGQAGSEELLLGIQMSAKVHTLAVYSMSPLAVTELMKTNYTRYRALDMDGDGQREIFVLQMDQASGSGRLERYRAGTESGLILTDNAPLSVDITSITSVRSGQLNGGIPALFVTSSCGENMNLTDVFALRDGKLANISMREETLKSEGTVRAADLPAITDINGDFILELPEAVPLPLCSASSAGDSFRLVRWNRLDMDGEKTPVLTAYHSPSDGYYLTIPPELEANLAISRKDNANVSERALQFWYLPDQEAEPLVFLTIYRLGGANRFSRARLGNRFLLYEDRNVIYAAELTDAGLDSLLTPETLLDSFHMMRAEFSGD